jgi:hypothetical protein
MEVERTVEGRRSRKAVRAGHDPENEITTMPDFDAGTVFHGPCAARGNV